MSRIRFIDRAAICLWCPALVFIPLAQEESVRPGINAAFENPDLNDFLQKFEGESREIAANSKENRRRLQAHTRNDGRRRGAGTGLLTRKFAAEVGEKGKVFAVDILKTFFEAHRKTCRRARSRMSRRFLCDQSRPSSRSIPSISCLSATFITISSFPQRTLQSSTTLFAPEGIV